MNSDILEDIVSLVSKTVKGDPILIYQIIFNGLSAYTSKPIQLMVMEKSSEGKTYPALQISQHFPSQNVITLGSVTPQSFKYDHGIQVDKEYKPLGPQLEELDTKSKALKISKSSSTNDKKLRELEEQRNSLLVEAKTLIDLQGKWIIFKEPPDHRLLEALYSTLSSDEEYNEHRFVNKTNKGRNQNFNVVFKGTPAILICTSKDESRNARWLETFSRFNIISPTSTPTKYAEGMALIGLSYGLPKKLYEESVISNEDRLRLKDLIQKLVKQIQISNGEIFNPFSSFLSSRFPSEVGYRWRQFQRFNNMITLHCLCYSENRPKLLIDGKKIPVIIKSDIMWAMNLMKDQESIPPNKMTWFREIFLPIWKTHSVSIDFSKKQDGSLERKILIANDIKKYLEEQKMGNPTTKSIRENYLDTLFEHGLIEKEGDPRNKTRDAYWPTEGYSTQSPLIDISSNDELYVKSFLDQYLKQRFSFEVKGKNLTQNDIIPYILSKENVIEIQEIMPKV